MELAVERQISDGELRAAVEQAWLEGQPLSIVYDGRKDTIRRIVRMRIIVMERTQTLLDCDDLDLGEPRQFRLDRIVAAEVVPNYSAKE